MTTEEEKKKEENKTTSAGATVQATPTSAQSRYEEDLARRKKNREEDSKRFQAEQDYKKRKYDEAVQRANQGAVTGSVSPEEAERISAEILLGKENRTGSVIPPEYEPFKNKLESIVNRLAQIEIDRNKGLIKLNAFNSEKDKLLKQVFNLTQGQEMSNELGSDENWDKLRRKSIWNRLRSKNIGQGEGNIAIASGLLKISSIGLFKKNKESIEKKLQPWIQERIKQLESGTVTGKNCIKCGKALSPPYNYCTKCGASQQGAVASYKFCIKCGAPRKGNFCIRCGYRFPN